ncbi:MAG: DUF2062 domain-containing protein [Candidatus Nanoarchaeia archaeon]
MKKLLLDLKHGPKHWYEQVKQVKLTPFEIAMGYSIGIFLSVIALPIINIVLLFLALLILRINKIAAILGYITLLWPLSPALYYASLRIGLFIFQQEINLSIRDVTFEIIKKYLIYFAVGNVLLSVAIAAASFAIIYGVARAIQIARWGRGLFLPPTNKAN